MYKYNARWVKYQSISKSSASQSIDRIEKKVSREHQLSLELERRPLDRLGVRQPAAPRVRLRCRWCRGGRPSGSDWQKHLPASALAEPVGRDAHHQRVPRGMLVRARLSRRSRALRRYHKRCKLVIRMLRQVSARRDANAIYEYVLQSVLSFLRFLFSLQTNLNTIV